MQVVPVQVAMAADRFSEGKKLYDQNCIFCHQADAIGKPGFAPSLRNKEFLSVSSDKFIMSTIRDGRTGTGMAPFAHLGKKKITAIVAYLRSYAKLPNISKMVDAQPRSQGDERLGQFWFDSICSTCHGPKGDGYAAGGTGTAIGKAGFLDKASDGYIRVTIKDGRSNTRMIGYSGPAAMAALSDSDIDDIIAYLRTVPSKN
ncbi:MAG: c-type cytochrome [Gammaproteobacteria bacterium]|nr:c-type cytochrome [Gammaproteobacteria bacterium]MCK5092194.1 c-type cytochrome [Gammaproteobacteria bacterium]